MTIDGDRASVRRRAATMGRKVVDRHDFDQFISEFGESEDPLIARLVELLEHEPQCGGFLGGSQAQYDAYRSEIDQAIQQLETPANKALHPTRAAEPFGKREPVRRGPRG